MNDITFLELDLTGEDPDNWIKGEEHTLIQVPGKKHRVFVCTHGGFYTNGFVLRDSTGKALVRGKDYVLTYHYEKLSEMTGQNVMGLVVIVNASVTPVVRAEYHAVGGFFSVSVKELKALMEKIDETNLKFTWEEIIGKPTAYTPSEHMHKYWQLYGLESTVVNINRLGDAWAVGRTAILAAGTDYYKYYVQLAKDDVQNYINRVNAHITDENNPHSSDKVKIKLGQINNWPMATKAQTTDTSLTNVYMPIGGIFNLIQSILIPKITDHIRNQNNPHGLTLAIMNLYSKAEIDAIYAQRLHRTQRAFTSKRLAGVGWEQLYFPARVDLDASNVWNITRFELKQFVTTFPTPWPPTGTDPQGRPNIPSDYCIMGNGQIVHFRDLFATYNANARGHYYAGGRYASAQAAISALQANISQIADGGYGFAQYLLDFNNGRKMPTMVVMRRNGSSLTRIV